MQFPKSPSDFSINLPSEVVAYIESLSVVALKSLIFDVSYAVAESEPIHETSPSDTFDFSVVVRIDEHLTGNDYIYFMQWLLCGLAQAVN